MIPYRAMGRASALALALLAAGIVVAAPTAAAQCAACDQYVPPAQHHPGGGGPAAGGKVNGPGATGAPGGFSGSPPAQASGSTPSGASLASPAPSATEHGGGSVPIVDYPATPLIWVLLAAAALAVLIPCTVAAHRRLRGRPRSAT